jgi:NAD(P)-dependent dehydrogenase (short-subunit alcohol dehydrogenase family)
MRLQNKVIVITGAAGIIGSSTARAFVEQGARVVLVDSNKERLQQVDVDLNPASIECLVADVANAQDMARVIETAEKRFGQIDVFFANAGIEGSTAYAISDQSDEVFDKVMEVNVRGVFLGVKAAIPRMKDGGSVIITSSVMGLAGAPFNVAYTTSKHAVVGIRRSCAMLGGPRQIRVNTIHPGYVDSEMLDRLINQHPDPDGRRKLLEAKSLFKRLTQPAEVVNAALFLASDESSGITNQGLVVDCGTLD